MIVHAFEKAGLGVAPFRFVGVERKAYQACHGAPIQPGGSCQYCGTGIIECCIIRDAEGKTFIVGNVCVRKTNDRGLIDTVKREVSRLRREAKREKDSKRIADAKALLSSVADSLAAKPHPTDFMAEKGHTLLSYVEFLFDNAGYSGMVKAARIVEKEKEEGGRS
jgi:hypothetical protein